MTSSLAGLRVLDLTRVLAGPYCTQMLGDLGAEVIKVERPFSGDDTRQWGPPFLKDADGGETTESAYYLSVNRNKKSVAIDITTPEGQALIRNLIGQSDILIENFKVGGLDKYGLGYEQLREEFPSLIYCAISGYGQTGTLSNEPGYDFVAQGMSGLMACTGEPDGPPIKAGVALSDIITGLHAAIGILAALNHRRETGAGQMVDVSLLDCSLASLTNIAQYYLTSGQNAPRTGNAHSTIVPYQNFETADGHVIIAIGNDGQFGRFCDFIEQSEWSKDERFATNRARLRHRDSLVPMIADIIGAKPTEHWIEGLRAVSVPTGPINKMDEVFAEPQVQKREMQISMAHLYGDIDLVGSPLKLSATPPSYDLAPPVCGQHTSEVLQDVLGVTEDTLGDLQNRKIIESFQ